MRDDFSEEAKRILAQRVGYQCSNPECRKYTSGPQVSASKAVNIGVAAHITAASHGGPRYDKGLTSDQRSHITNAIWLCQNCAKLVDNDSILYTADLLRRWKHDAERAAYLRVGRSAATTDGSNTDLSGEEVDILVAVAQSGEIILLSSEQTGKWVRANGNDYYEDGDPAYARSYVDALKSLCRRRLAEHDEGNLFMLTTAGFKLARLLKEKAAPEYTGQ
jgi:hypothetical protein